MPAERDSAQVILLLHGVTFAVEAVVFYPSVGYHLFGSGSALIKAIFGIVGAEVNPCVIGLRSEFILQFDMVEVIVVNVEAIYIDWHIIASFILWRECIHYPFIGWE